MEGEGEADSLTAEIAQSPTQAVIEAVATMEDVQPAELGPPEYEPLKSTIDPDALDTLFERRSTGVPRPGGSVSFQYNGYTVTVDWGETVTVEDAIDDGN